MKTNKYSHFILFLVPLIVSILVWMNPEFFTPETYINYGDMEFPLDPLKAIRGYFYAWKSDFDLGQYVHYTAHFIPNLLVYLSSIAGIPLWIINRLWVILPLTMVGWSTSYLFLTLFSGKNARIAGIIASVFAMLSPLSDIYPYQYMSLSGFSLVLSIIAKIMNRDRITYFHYFLFVTGVILLTFSPRYLYLSIIVVFLYTSMALILERRIAMEQVKYLSTALLLAILSVSYILLPIGFLFFYTKGKMFSHLYSHILPSYQTGLNLWFDYKDWVNPIWVLRLFVNNPMASPTPLLSTPLISTLLFIMPIYAFLCLFFVRNTRVITIAVITICFLSLSISAGNLVLSKLYLFLWKYIPGFSMFKAPLFFIFFLNIFYGLLTGITTQALLERIDASQYTVKIKKALKVSLVSILLVLIGGVYGNGLLIGRSPKDNIWWGKVIYANHTPSMKIPNEYYELRDYLVLVENKSERLLNLPFSPGGYYPYKWWFYWDRPDIMNFLSPIPILTYPSSPYNWLSDIEENLRINNVAATVKIMNIYGIKYVLVHKDYFTIKGWFEPEKVSGIYIENMKNYNDYFEPVMDNEYFILFKNKDNHTTIFSSDNILYVKPD